MRKPAFCYVGLKKIFRVYLNIFLLDLRTLLLFFIYIYLLLYFLTAVFEPYVQTLEHL